MADISDKSIRVVLTGAEWRALSAFLADAKVARLMPTDRLLTSAKTEIASTLAFHASRSGPRS